MLRRFSLLQTSLRIRASLWNTPPSWASAKLRNYCSAATNQPPSTEVSNPPDEQPSNALPNAVAPVLWRVSPVEDGSRLDRFVKRRAPGLPPGLIQKQIRQRRVLINSESAIRNAAPVYSGDVVRFPGDIKLGLNRRKKKPKDNDVSLAEAEIIRSWVLHRDARCAVLDKPPGLPVQAGGGRCLEDLLCGIGSGRYWLVHRLDKEVSGAIIVARDVGAAGLIAEAFRSRTVSKRYWALVTGKVNGKEGTINSPIDEKKAVTRWRVMQRLDNQFTWLELEPRTGRKHQLRIHCADVLGAPILGDHRYGPENGKGESFYSGLHLVSKNISFPRMTQVGGGGKRSKRGKPSGLVSVTAPLPPHMKDTWKRFGLDEKIDEH